jgi:Ca2+-binding EF-hand superfamily protein
VDGHGLLDEIEAKHFLNLYMSDYTNKQVVSEAYFSEWFRKIDQDGDGKIDMI